MSNKTNKKLKTLKQYEDEKIEGFTIKEGKLHFNGLKCPKCGSELIDSRPGIALLSNPPKKYIHCSNNDCNYSGYTFI